MYKKISVAIIATLMITGVLASLSITAAGTHDSSGSVTVEGLKKIGENQRKVFKLTVTNDSGDPIRRVTITSVPGPFTGFNMVYVLPKDNYVELANENVVGLKKGTQVFLKDNNDACLWDNTVVLKKKGENIWVTTATGDWVEAKLETDAKIKIRSGVGGYPLENTEDNITIDDNLELLYTKRVTLENEKTVRVKAATDVEKVGTDLVAPIDNMDVYKVGDNYTRDNIIEVTDNVKILAEIEATLIDNLANNYATLVEGIKATTAAGTGQEFPAGRRVQLDSPDENMCHLREDTKIAFVDNNSVLVKENTVMIVKNGDSLYTPAAVTLENKTPGWVADNTAKEWTTTVKDKMIEEGESEDFYFALTAPDVTGEETYSFDIETEDNEGILDSWSTSVTVDGKLPTVDKILIDGTKGEKVWKKAGENVTIKVVMTEEIENLSPSWVTENDPVPPATIDTIPMETDDNINWEGTFTLTDNVAHDGVTQIKVWGDNYQDIVGNPSQGDVTNNYLIVDRRKPFKPTAKDLEGDLKISPRDNLKTMPGVQLNTDSLTITGYAVDNRFDNNAPNDVRDNVPGMTIMIDNETRTSDSAGHFSYSTDLNEGLNKMKVRFVDLAGNQGPENELEFFVDTRKPTISCESIAGKSYTKGMKINENKPTIVLTIKDPGYADGEAIGIENMDWKPKHKAGFVVGLYKDGTLKKRLGPKNNAKAWDNGKGPANFENTLTGLKDGVYTIRAMAGDNIWASDNVLFKFEIDTEIPDKPLLVTAGYPTATQAEPKVLTEAEVTITGECEENATVKIYTSTDGVTWTPGPVATNPTPTTWTVTVSVTPGTPTQIAVTQTDEAKNESEKRLFGWVMADASKPGITDVTINGKAKTELTTDKITALIEGKVTMDDWEDPADITLRITYGTTSMTLDLDKNGGFSKSVSLSEGSNTISLVATDEAGNQSAATHLKVTRTVTPLMTYAAIIAVIAIILAAIAILSRRGSTGSSGSLGSRRGKGL